MLYQSLKGLSASNFGNYSIHSIEYFENFLGWCSDPVDSVKPFKF